MSCPSENVFRLTDMPREIFVDIVQRALPLAGTDLAAPALLQALKINTELYEIASEIYHQENRTFVVGSATFEDTRKELRQLSLRELDRLRCIRFVWTSCRVYSQQLDPLRANKIVLLNKNRQLDLGLSNHPALRTKEIQFSEKPHIKYEIVGDTSGVVVTWELEETSGKLGQSESENTSRSYGPILAISDLSLNG
ncbi:hypothetical protein GLAREA_07790 [Glarea lozoyensis ATCC 20868]|uniref:F-box domain-containing protein n=1 Tax=Glarea lozoyensis (strain ATCC 20868 / MF5171) TaxID=1116229 RepID=S3DKS0_GLAL2|nr:uncharacterized protein GLAREA_07790 [Glarea lozoyensis ATCC 20868]EPE32656.1 hypothetical protein GLAREA_07790 [Glarea lozoyensis ATCC 20868]